MMYGYGFPWIGGIVMMVFWVLFVGAIIWAVVYVTRSATRPPAAPPRGETPLDIAKRRYASGEIDKAQFEEIKRNLEA